MAWRRASTGDKPAAEIFFGLQSDVLRNFLPQSFVVAPPRREVAQT